MLTFFGRGSGFSNENNSAYIEIGNSIILIDCGYTVFNAVRTKLDLSTFDNIYVVITHLHPDHAGSLGQLILYSGYVVRKKVVVVTKCKNIRKLLDIIGVNREFYQVDDGHGINLDFIETRHTDLLDAYGFVIKINEKKIVYTGDTSILEPFEKALKKADELYVDVSKKGIVHLQIDEVFHKLLEIQNRGTKVYLMHLDDEEYVRDITKGKLEFAKLN